MPFLTIAAITVPVLQNGARETDREYAGDFYRTINMTLRSNRHSPKRNWTFETPPVAQSELNALRSAIDAAGGIVVCSGDALEGATVSCGVTIKDIPYFANNHSSFLRPITIQLREA